MEEEKKIHLPRYAELPEIDLYADQVISYLNTHLAEIKPYSAESDITRTMINNYVKQGVVTSPIKKKYNRNHLAYLFAVCILKNAFSIPEVTSLIAYQISVSSIEGAYNTFCNELESAIENVRTDNNYTFNKDDEDKLKKLRIVITTIIYKSTVQTFVHDINKSRPFITKKKK